MTYTRFRSKRFLAANSKSTISTLLITYASIFNAGCAQVQTLTMSNYFPAKESSHTTGVRIIVLPVIDELQASTERTPYKSDSTYLDNTFGLWMAAGPIFFPPIVGFKNEFHADIRRAEIVRSAAIARLNVHGIVALDNTSGSHLKRKIFLMNYQELLLKLRGINVGVNSFEVADVVLASGFGVKSFKATVELRCQLNSAGGVETLWGANVEGVATAPRMDGGARKALGNAMINAVDKCLNDPGFRKVQRREPYTP